MKPLIIIPAYNEAENIAFVINDIKEHFQEADILNLVNVWSTLYQTYPPVYLTLLLFTSSYFCSHNL